MKVISNFFLIFVFLFNAAFSTNIVHSYSKKTNSNFETILQQETISPTPTVESSVTATQPGSETTTPDTPATPPPPEDSSATPTVTPEVTITSEFTQTPTGTATPVVEPAVEEGLPAASSFFEQSFFITVTPPLIKAGGQITLYWSIQEFDSLRDFSPKLQIILPAGIQPENEKDGVWEQPILTIHPTEAEGRIQLLLPQDPPDMYSITAELLLKDELYRSTEVFLAKPNQARTDAASKAIGMEGKISVEFPEKAFPQELDIVVLPLTRQMRQITGANESGFELLAFDKSGNPVRRFDQRVKIEIQYDPAVYGGNEAAAYLSYFDEEKLEWVELHTAFDTESHTATVYTDHFTIFNLNSDNLQSPLITRPDHFQVAEFTGAGTFSIPITLPPGPGGFQPSLSLEYNSQIVDSANIYTQANWVGMGWSLDVPYIFRDMHGTASDTSDDTFHLVLNSVSHRLLKDASGAYHTENETYIKINYYIPQTNYEPWWEVWDKEGNRYVFGQKNLHSSDAPNNRFISRYLRVKGENWAFDIYRWSVNTITNKFGKELRFTYTEFTKPVDRDDNGYNDDHYDRSVLPESIVYPNNRYRVWFTFTHDRNDYRTWWDNTPINFFYDKSRLTALKIQHNPDGNPGFTNATTIYQYNFLSNLDNVPDMSNAPVFTYYTWDAGGKTLALNALQMVAFDSNNQPSYQPMMKFHYEDQMHLTRVENGYGGIYQYSYEPWSTHKEDYENFNPHDNPNYPALWMQYVGEANEGLTFINGEVYFYLKYPHNSYQKNYLGSFYELRVEYGVPYENTTVTAKIAIDDGRGNIFKPDGTSGYYEEVISRQVTPVFKILNLKFILPSTSDPANTNFRLLCKVGNTQCWRYKLQFRRLPTYYRVSTRTISDQKTNKTYTYLYTYTGGSMNNEIGFGDFNFEYRKFYDSPFTLFRGYEKVIVEGPDQKVITTTFGQLKRGQATYTQLYLTGKPLRVTVMNGNNVLQAETVYDYSTTVTMPAYPFNDNNTVDTRIRWVRTTSEENYIYNSNGTLSSGTKKYFHYDPARQNNSQYGNLTNMVESYRIGENQWQDYRVHFWGFFPNTTQPANDPSYLVSFPAYHNIYSCLPSHQNGACYTPGQGFPSPQAVSSQWYLYDGNNMYNIMPATGKLTGSRFMLYWQNPATFWGPIYQDTKYEYDSWGNQISVSRYTQPNGHDNFASGTPQTTTYCYGVSGTPDGCTDDGYYTFLKWEKNALSHPPLQYLDYDFRLGKPRKIRDANGNETLYAFDSFGRMTSMIRPGDSTSLPTTLYSYCDTCDPYTLTAVQRIEAGNNSLLNTKRIFYDGLGRVIQTYIANATLQHPEGSGVESRDIVVDYEYDAYDRIIKQTVPYDTLPTNIYKGQAFGFQPFTTTTYDLLGRPLQVTRPDGSLESRYNYNGTVTEIFDAKNQKTTQSADAWGRIIEVLPAAGPKTQYSYDVEDNLVNVRQIDRNSGSAFATTTISYDIGGRKTSLNDPDMGVWTYAYDALGNLTRQTDARGQRICLYYDALNRLLGKHYRSDDACPASPTYQIGFTYDLGTNGSGQRTGMSDSSGSTTWMYDARGRLISETKTITGHGSYRTDWVYNSADLLKQIIYPGGNTGTSGEVVSYTYTPQLTMTSANGSAAYVPETRYDAAGRMVEQRLGGSLAAPVIRQTFDYFDWKTDTGSNCLTAGMCGRLRNLHAESVSPKNSRLNLTYSYDSVGNITKIDDAIAGGPQTQNFGYDSLNRLTFAKESGGENGIYGVEYYQYDPVTGNLIHKGNVGQVYGNGHAVVRSGTNTYTYDQNGNMISRTIAVANLFANPGFESSATWIEGRDSKYPATAFYRTTWGTASPNTESFAYSISNHAYGYLQSDLITVEANKQYDLYAWIRGEIDPEDSEGGGWAIRAHFYDINGNAISTTPYTNAASGAPGSVGTTWQNKGGRITTPEGTAKVRIILYLYMSSGWVAFDNVEFKLAGTTTNLVANPGFENSGGWTEVGSSVYPATSFRRSYWGTASPYAGTYAYAISNQAYGYLQSDPISISPGIQYSLYSWIRGEIDPEDSEGGGWVIRAHFYDASGNPLASNTYIEVSSGGPGSLTTTWQQKGGQFTAPTGAAFVRVQLFLFLSTGWVAYDDVELKQVGNSTNRVLNPGFESSSNWSEVRVSNHPGTSFIRSTWGIAAPRSGSYTYAISNHASGELRSESIPVAGNADYDLYTFVRGEFDPDGSHGGWSLRVNYYDATGAYLSYQDSTGGSSESLSINWTYKGGRIRTPANAASVTIRLYIYHNSGWIAFDDLLLTKVSDYQTTNLTYDAENRLVEVKQGSNTLAAFTYDGDGNRVKGVVGGTTTVYIGNHFEWSGSTTTMKKYYYAGGTRVAMRTGSSLNWLLGDHLGSTSVVTDANGANPITTLYKPWGETRYTSGTLPTEYKYTGQRETVLGLYDYKARFYDPYLNRFLSPDSIIPNIFNSIDWDRYAYARNNPVRYNDPSGHCPVCIAVGLGIAVVVWLANPEIVYAPSPGYTPPTGVDPSYGDKAYFDAAPGTGDISDIYAAVTGRTLFTGEEIRTQDRIVAGVFSLLPVASSAGLRQGRKFITGIDNAIPDSNTIVRHISGKLDPATKNVLRDESRSIFYNANPRLKDTDLQIHHRIPLEWAHLFPDADPNRLSNLIGLESMVHKSINRSWSEFRAYYRQLGRSPTAQQVLDFAAGLDYGN